MSDPHSKAPHAFPPTRWTLVRAVREGGDSAHRAIEELCRHYWFPVYAFLRRRGHNPHDAEDLTQGFFATLLEDETFTRATPERGRLRSFLLHALEEYVVEERRHDTRLKRGGGATHVPLDIVEGEQRYASELLVYGDPGALFDRGWAQTLIAKARARLQADYGAAGKAALLEAIEPHLEGAEEAVPYAELAACLNSTETALRLAVFRARRKLRALLIDEIRRTVSDADEAEAELRWLFTVMGV